MGNNMEPEQKLETIQALTEALMGMEKQVKILLDNLERGTGAREIALARTAIQEARHWSQEARLEIENAW